MLSVKQEEAAQVETVIGKGCQVEGQITLEGPLRIDGSVTGKIRTRSTVVVSPTARLTAEVTAATIVVHGSVDGDLVASALIELHSTARVKGAIEAPAVEVERGAVFEGTCRMEEKAQAAPKQRAVA